MSEIKHYRAYDVWQMCDKYPDHACLEFVSLYDHERDVAEKITAAVADERKRCRDEEVEPLLTIAKQARDEHKDDPVLRIVLDLVISSVEQIQKELP